MITKRRQSSSYAEELFEFVDYTSVSNFERLVTAIEEILLSWGVKDGSHGVFSDTALSTNAKKNTTTSNSNEYARHESISVGDEAYKLTYYCHAISLGQNALTKYPFSFDEFYLFNPPQQVSNDTTKVFHPLHRWTGIDRFFILTPVSDSLKSKLFSSSKNSVDIHQSKYLISACSTAFNNLHCSIPVFIQIGQARYHTFNGYMFQQDDKMDLDIRFEMSVIPTPNLRCHMCDFLDLFTQKLDIHRFNNRNNHSVAPLTLHDKQNTLTGAAFTYNLKNWFDENWKQWDDTSDILRKNINKSIRSENSMCIDIIDSMKPLPPLPFGSYNDPLRTLTLSTIFPLSNTSHYLENELNNNMDALTAKFWIITREFAQLSQQRGYLSTLLSQLISSWIKDPSNRDYLAPYDSNNNSNMMDNLTERDSGIMRNLIHAVSQNRGSIPTVAQTGQITFMKTDQVEDIVSAVFDLEEGHRYTGKMYKEYIQLRDTNDDISLYTSQSLGLRLRNGTIAPWRSFLWNLLVYGLHAFIEISNGNGSTSSTSSSSSSSSSYMGFLRILWVEVLRRIRWHWEHLVPIPNVDPHLYHPSSTNNEDSLDNDPQYEDTLGIDLRYNILHQKLTMINCCIHQRLKESGINKKSKATPKSNKSLSNQTSKSNNNLTDTLTDFLEEITDTKKEMLVDSDTPSDISDTEMFFDSMEDIETIIPIKNKATANTNSCSSSISDASEVIPPTSMNESFVRLNYSSSTESDQYHQEPNDFGDIDDWLGVSKESEINDPDAYEGRSHQHKSILLLKTNTPLWVPITQNPGFMTEDMIQQQADVFESLGTSDNATKLRAKLQSAQLYSDMQAFKAANPHSILEDFVRWHSPKDWIEYPDDPSSGHLSSRMSQPTNIWQELWKCSRRIPSSRQRSLFNLNAEGEKALHYLESMPVYEMFSSLLPTLGVIMYDTLASHPIVKYIRPVTMGIKQLGEELINYPWESLKNGKINFDGIINCIRKEESHMCSAISLLRKFPCQYNLVERLLQNSQTQVEEGEERDVVFNLYKNEYGGISKPSYKEFIFYMNNSNNLDTPLPQRQYVLLNDSELRVVDMYSIDGRYC
ncbi:Rab3 GTPase-activating protein catalytic subunit-domain-containing protein [Cunninghamella echinulata]|nr:Rab3 GTPase-activating protein catalytic subunit-domain-containing protein [Cunninghamella echinulata]